MSVVLQLYRVPLPQAEPSAGWHKLQHTRAVDPFALQEESGTLWACVCFSSGRSGYNEDYEEAARAREEAETRGTSKHMAILFQLHFLGSATRPASCPASRPEEEMYESISNSRRGPRRAGARQWDAAAACQQDSRPRRARLSAAGESKCTLWGSPPVVCMHAAHRIASPIFVVCMENGSAEVQPRAIYVDFDPCYYVIFEPCYLSQQS